MVLPEAGWALEPARPNPATRKVAKKKLPRRKKKGPAALPRQPAVCPALPEAPRPAPCPALPEAAPREPVPEPVVPEPDPAPEGEEEPDALLRWTTRGFIESRSIAMSTDEDAPLYGIMQMRPSPRSLLQVNLQPQLKLRGDRLGAAGDLSLYLSVVEPQRLALINELYVEGRLGPVRVLAGRRRLVWGSGLTASPTDLLNPAKDPLNPEQQRTGALLLPMVDLTVGPFILTGLVSPRLKTNSWALPREVQFEEALYAARLYALFGGIDLNLIYYREQGAKRDFLGLAASGFVGDWVELHGEALGRKGAADLPPLPTIPLCGEPPTTPSNRWTLRALLGSRVHFEDQSLLIAEYLYDGQGLSGENYDRLRDQAPCLAAILATLGPSTEQPAPSPLGFPSEPVFLVRPHHLVVSYTRPQLTRGLLEDVSVSAGMIMSPVDLSAILDAQVGYDFEGRARVGARVFYWAGRKTSEMGAWPGRVAGIADLRVSF